MRVSIPKDYIQGLREARPTILKRKQPLPGAASDMSNFVQIIPPLNTDINFSSLSRFSLSDHPRMAQFETQQIPENFNWRDVLSTDSDVMKKKKSMITKPPNQALCGSCWAVSTASVISDTFIVSGTLNYNPQISSTYALSCYPQAQCKGGAPATLVTDIHNSGISSEHCVDYSWCSEHDSCNGKATGHFTETEDISSLIPPCGCVDAGEKYIYHIDKPTTLAMKTDADTDVLVNIKKHIYLNGPVVGGFMVYSNFMTGEFTKRNGGVYLERGNYDDSIHLPTITFDDSQISPDNYKGSHAISIIGWGIAKGIQVDNDNKKADVPYWFCRNSWGDKWGDNGYFKVAMYPFNKIIQFERNVDIDSGSGSTQTVGGVILITTTQLLGASQTGTKNATLQTFKSNNYKGPLAQPVSFYQEKGASPIGGGGGGGDGGGDGGGKNKYSFVPLLVAGGVIIFSFVLLFVIIKTVHRRKEYK